MDQVQSNLARINNYDLGGVVDGVLEKDPAYVVYFNEADLSSLDASQIRHLVARTSDAYTRISIASAVARTRKKAAEAYYKRAFKIAKSHAEGANADQREASALEETQDAAERLEETEAYYNICVAAEEAARVASETARKLLGTMVQARMDSGAADASRSRSGEDNRW